MQGNTENASVNFRIYDRWGGLFFEVKNALINDGNFGWNGTYKGKKAQGIFVWQAEVAFENETVLVKSGSSVLIR